MPNLSANGEDWLNDVSAALQRHAYSVKHRLHEFKLSMLNFGFQVLPRPEPNQHRPSASQPAPLKLPDIPASSKLNLFEGFVKKVVNELKANEELWESTAIFVTVDEGGGYYDAGYIQPLDFFGDGPRIPLIVVSPYTSAGHISHTYVRSRFHPEVHRAKLGPRHRLKA
jgi:Phosphoesterase family